MKTNTQLAGALALILAVGVLGAMVARPVEATPTVPTLKQTIIPSRGAKPLGQHEWMLVWDAGTWFEVTRYMGPTAEADCRAMAQVQRVPWENSRPAL